jgi:polyhydroxyalkanoate synthesis regulator phasin
MAQSPDWNQLLEAGKQFGALTRHEAERRVQELIRRGELAQERFQAVVDELLERSREAADEIIVRGRQGADDVRDLVRVELRRQVKALGLVTRDDLARFAARLGVGRGATKASNAPAKKAPAAKKAGGAKKTAAKKAGGAKKTAAKKAGGAKKTAAKKAGGAKKIASTNVAKRSSPPRGPS